MSSDESHYVNQTDDEMEEYSRESDYEQNSNDDNSVIDSDDCIEHGDDDSSDVRGSDDDRSDAISSDDDRSDAISSDDDRSEARGSDDDRSDARGSDDDRSDARRSDDDRSGARSSDDNRSDARRSDESMDDDSSDVRGSDEDSSDARRSDESIDDSDDDQNVEQMSYEEQEYNSEIDMESEKSIAETETEEKSEENMSDIDYSYESKVKVPVDSSTVIIKHPATECTCERNCSFHSVLEQIPRWLISLISDELMNGTIQQHRLQELGGGRFSSYNIMNVRRVKNNCIWARYVNKRQQIKKRRWGRANESLIFHGTTYENMCSIMKYGFEIMYAKENGMFGTAIYFAEHSSKANQYVYGPLGGNGCPDHRDKSCYICPRYLILSRVCLGRVYKLNEADNYMTKPPRGFDSVKGVPSPGGLMYPEYAIYDEDQIYPEFIIAYRIVR